MKTVQVGLVGFGTVGSGVVRLLTEHEDRFRRRLGEPLVLKKVADIDLARPRLVSLAPELFTDKVQEILADPEIDVVIELIGGVTEAYDLIMAALARGKHVVTANKALLALHGNEIFQAASRAGVEVGFEASVCGGIPLILTLRQGLAANSIQEIFGILNGTSNYILSKMSMAGASFQQALVEAQAQGYAEADPTLDVEGIDAAHKLAILMALAYGTQINFGAIHVEGITRLEPIDIQLAREFGYQIKLLAITRDDGQRVEARVHPTMLPLDHIMASVQGAFNAVYITGDAVGPILLYGQGAGMMPTASAVAADLIDLAYNISHGVAGRVPPLGVNFADQSRRPIKPLEEIVTNYYFRFAAVDRPGVLSAISGILARFEISIAAVIQKGREIRGSVPVVMITHEAKESHVQQALAEIDRLAVITEKTIVIRIEDPNLDAAQI
ncbi:homoserine dehydrogenase [Desulfobacca acetoxidans]